MTVSVAVTLRSSQNQPLSEAQADNNLAQLASAVNALGTYVQGLQNTSASIFGIAMQGPINEAAAVTLASAATVAIGAATANTIFVTGSAAITAFDVEAAGAVRRLVFAGALVLTYNATSLILPTAANITTAANDAALFLSLGAGNWQCVGYARANGTPLATSVPLGTGASLNADTDTSLAANSDANVATQKATKAYVDAKLAGLSWKQAVRVATTAAGTLATSFANGSSIDGVTVATGDRILIKDQATASENGIYVVAATGAPTRATDADAGTELVNATVYVSEGTINADTQWTCTTNAPIAIGTTGIAFSHINTTAYSLASDIHAATSKTPPVDADEFPIADSASSYTLKKLTWANLKATIASYITGLANVFTNVQAVTPYRASISGAVSIDLAAVAKSNNLHLTLTGNVTSFAVTNPVDGAVYKFRFIQDATGGRTFSGFPAAFKFQGGTAPTFSSTANAVDFMRAEYGSTEATYMADFLKGMA